MGKRSKGSGEGTMLSESFPFHNMSDFTPMSLPSAFTPVLSARFF